MKNSKLKILSGIFLAALILAGCASKNSGRAHPGISANDLLENPRIAYGITVPEYELGFGDVLEVKFFNNETVAVRPDGRITLERVGEIFVAGMTPAKLDTVVTKIYSEIIQNPDVTIFVREFGGYQVYVLGEVNSPGGYPVQREMTILQAIASAGGSKTGAKMNSVMIIRRGHAKDIDAFQIDLTKWTKGNVHSISPYSMYVKPLDIVYVPRTFIADASTFLKQVYDGLIPPLNLYLQALWWKRWSEN